MKYNNHRWMQHQEKREGERERGEVAVNRHGELGRKDERGVAEGRFKEDEGGQGLCIH